MNHRKENALPSGPYRVPNRYQTSHRLLIPVMWALDSGDVGRRRSEATLVVFYSSQVAHMSQEKDR